METVKMGKALFDDVERQRDSLNQRFAREDAAEKAVIATSEAKSARKAARRLKLRG